MKNVPIIVTTLILVSLNGFLSIKVIHSKRDYRLSFENTDNQAACGVRLKDYILLSHSVEMKKAKENILLYSLGLEEIKLISILDNPKAIFYFSKNVCGPCADRFLEKVAIINTNHQIRSAVIIAEAWNVRDVMVLKEKYKIGIDLYFTTEGSIFETDYLLDKPLLFVMGSDMNPRFIFISDESVNEYLAEIIDQIESAVGSY